MMRSVLDENMGTDLPVVTAIKFWLIIASHVILLFMAFSIVISLRSKIMDTAFARSGYPGWTLILSLHFERFSSSRLQRGPLHKSCRRCVRDRLLASSPDTRTQLYSSQSL